MVDAQPSRRTALALLCVFLATLVVYALLIVVGSFVFSAGSASFAVLFWYMGVLAPLICLYLDVQILKFFRYPASKRGLLGFAIVGFLGLSIIGVLMGYANALQGSRIAWNIVLVRALVHLISFVCPVLFLGRKLLAGSRAE